jgi:hypothetical protein
MLDASAAGAAIEASQIAEIYMDSDELKLSLDSIIHQICNKFG